MFSSETYELTVQDYVARRVTYNHLRRVRVVRSNREITTGNGGTELGGISRSVTRLSRSIKWIISW